MSREILTRPAPPADVRSAYGPNPLHFGDLRLPAGPGPHPVVVAIHGGYWSAHYGLDYMGHVCAALTDAGIATWNIEYRRIGHDGGGWPGTFHDLAQATAHVRVLASRYELDLARIVTLGHSVGGHAAMWLAAQARIPAGDVLYNGNPIHLRATIALGGVLDLRRAWELKLEHTVVERFMGGTPAAVPARYATGSPYELLPLRVQQVLIHGTHDDRVPYAISERYYQAAIAKGDDARLLPLEGAGHFECIDPQSREWSVVFEAVQQACAPI